MATTDIKKITLADGEHNLVATSMDNTGVGSSTQPVYFGTDGKPAACAFVITYGAIGSRPTTGTEGQIYFVI